LQILCDRLGWFLLARRASQLRRPHCSVPAGGEAYFIVALSRTRCFFGQEAHQQ